MTERESALLYTLMHQRLTVLKEQMQIEKANYLSWQRKKKKSIQNEINAVQWVLDEHTPGSSISLSCKCPEWMLDKIGF